MSQRRRCRMLRRFCAGLAAVSALCATPAVASTPSKDSIAPALTPGTFAQPPSTVRPKYRWWMPLAATDDDQLKLEINQLADAGAGGVEVTSFSAGTGFNTNPFL